MNYLESKGIRSNNQGQLIYYRDFHQKDYKIKSFGTESLIRLRKSSTSSTTKPNARLTNYKHIRDCLAEYLKKTFKLAIETVKNTKYKKSKASYVISMDKSILNLLQFPDMVYTHL